MPTRYGAQPVKPFTRTAHAPSAPATGKLVDPGRVRSEGSDLPPGHSGRGATLDSTAEQADA